MYKHSFCIALKVVVVDAVVVVVVVVVVADIADTVHQSVRFVKIMRWWSSNF